MLAHYTELVRLFPNDERAQTLLGNVYFGRQDYETAIEHFVKATTINPSFSQPYNQLGYAYRFLEKFDDAENAFKKYTQLIPDDPNPYDSYAELLMKMGRFDESIKMYEKALVDRPELRRLLRRHRQRSSVHGPPRQARAAFAKIGVGRAQHRRAASGALLDCGGLRSRGRDRQGDRGDRRPRTRWPKPSTTAGRCPAI